MALISDSNSVARASRAWSRFSVQQQTDRIDAEAVGNAFERFEGQVALAPFDAAHVGAVHLEKFCEVFLAESTGLPMGAQIASHRLLQHALHNVQRWWIATFESTDLCVSICKRMNVQTGGCNPREE